MVSIPRVVERDIQNYMSITRRIENTGIAKAAGENLPRVVEWVLSKGGEITGAPFIKYKLIANDGGMDVEFGIPIALPVEEDDVVKAGSFPAGSYVSMQHVGSYETLYEASLIIDGWAKNKELTPDVEQLDDGRHMAVYVEMYVTDPGEEEDSAKWVTEIILKLRD